MQLTFTAAPKAVTAARRAMRPLAAEAGADEHAVAVCVSEAVANAVFHAYRGRAAGEVRVGAEVVEGMLEVRIEDDGWGIAARDDSPGLGLGLPLMAAWSDQLVIEPTTTGSRVVLRFALAG